MARTGDLPAARRAARANLAMSRRSTLAAPLQSRRGMQDPDGVPHQIIGLTWALALGVALFAFAVLTGALSGVALAAVPAFVVGLARRADRLR